MPAADPRLPATDYRITGDPNGNRTRVFGVRGRRPRPLDDGTGKTVISNQLKRIENLFRKNNNNVSLTTDYRLLTTIYCLMAGAGGFEPPNAGTRTRCLTAWRRPNEVNLI